MKTGQRLCNTSRCISAKSMSPIALFGYFRGKQIPSIPPLLLPFLSNLCFSKVNKTTNIWYVSRSWAQKTQTKKNRGSLLFQDTHILFASTYFMPNVLVFPLPCWRKESCMLAFCEGSCPWRWTRTVHWAHHSKPKAPGWENKLNK